MAGKLKFILVLVAIFCLFILIQILFFVTHKNVTRSQTSLMNQYYRLKEKNPNAAYQTLEIVLKRNPYNLNAIRELGYWYLKQGNIKASITQFETVYKRDPQDIKTAIELSQLYLAEHDIDKAYTILSNLSVSQKPYAVQIKKLLDEISNLKAASANANQTATNSLTTSLSEIAIAYKKLVPKLQLINNVIQHPLVTFTHSATKLSEKSGIPATQSKANPTPHPSSLPSTISHRDAMMNKFYELKRNHSPEAWDQINFVIAKYPYDVQALKEAGYYALMIFNDDRLAEKYFLRVYQLTHDPKIALQLGYIYDKLREKHKAYRYFDLATNTTDMKDRMTAEIAKTNLRGMQTKFLPFPYYGTLDFSPLYMSRFKLMIYPIIAHLGVILNEQYNWRLYLSYRRTSDNKSNTSNRISNIFEDDAAITAIGSQISPLTIAPELIVFAELGKSVDLVYRDRSRFRTDFRGGLAYYNEWGRPAEYTLKPTFMAQLNADFYGDAVYYNRYHDGIMTLRARPGVKLFRYGSMSLDVYYRLFLIEDQARQFYNNIFENGPGLAIRFSDRYNIILRYEQTHGRYLPAGSPSPNPYSKNYHNTVTELDTYFEF